MKMRRRIRMRRRKRKKKRRRALIRFSIMRLSSRSTFKATLHWRNR